MTPKFISTTFDFCPVHQTHISNCLLNICFEIPGNTGLEQEIGNFPIDFWEYDLHALFLDKFFIRYVFCKYFIPVFCLAFHSLNVSWNFDQV